MAGKKCNQCNGTGRCPRCNGSGKIFSGQGCSACHFGSYDFKQGTGKCNKCDGTGEER